MEKTPTRKRNSERRKEKSRDAARCRRSRETEIFTSLSQALPLPESVSNTLDKASIMRIVISYLKLHRLLGKFPKSDGHLQQELTSMFMPATHGFLMILSTDGDFIYVSENVQEYLGLTQMDMMGNSVYELSHPCEHDEMREILACKSLAEDSRSLNHVRFKCTLTARGRNLNLKAASYKVMHCTWKIVSAGTSTPKAALVKRRSSSATDAEGLEEKLPSPSPLPGQPQYLMALATPIAHPSNIDIPLDHQAFVTKHSLDMKFTYADKNLTHFLGYSPDHLVGKSIYEFQHALDGPGLEKSFKCLLSQGQCRTGLHRFLAKGGGFVWVVTEATVIYTDKGQKESVVCVNIVGSGIEEKEKIYASSQVVEAKKARPVSVTVSVFNRISQHDVKAEREAEAAAAAAAQCPPRAVPTRPQPATAKIFAPKTEDMNKGFLTFSEEQPGLTVLKDEPEDLTHLAPMAGEVCTPLGFPHLGDMIDDFLTDSYCPLLAEDGSSSSCPSRTSASGDPFFSYRDDSNSRNSPIALDRRLAKSPEECSLPSLCSPEHDDEQLGLMCLGNESGSSELDEDLCRTAPYIPLDEDLPLLIPAVDVMWASSPSPSPPPAPPPRNNTSTLARLLKSTPDTLIKRTDHDWIKDTGQAMVGLRSANSPRSDDILRKAPPGVGPPERIGMKRSFCEATAAEAPGKRARSELLQHLMEPAPPRSHSVLMNLLGRGNLGALTDVLEHLRVARSERRIKEEQIKQQELRTLSSYLLQSDPGDAIPSLSDLSQRDCEVNAPVERSTLLQGEELLNALDYTDSMAL